MKYLDLSGLTYFWSKLKALLDNKQNKLICHTDDYTPSQILAYLQGGQQVVLTYGGLYFQDVAYSSGNNNVYASCNTVYQDNHTVIYMIGNTSTNAWSFQMVILQPIVDRVSDIISNATSTTKYPNTKAVYDQFQRKPVTIWETSTQSEMLNALQTNIAETMNWQLTGLDFSPYKYVKIYSKSGRGSTNAGTTPAIVLEMQLDAVAADTTHGGHFIGSALVQKPNDANRYCSLTCAISADKTSFCVLRQTSLYGTAATTNNDIGADVYKIVGYYE